MFLKELQFNITFDHFKNWPPKTGLRWDPEIHSARKVLDVCEFRFTSVYPLPSSAFGIGCTMLYLPRPNVVNASTPGWSLNRSLMKLSNSASLKTEFPDVRGLFDPLLPIRSTRLIHHDCWSLGLPPADGQVAEFLQGIYHVNRQHLPWEVWVPCPKVAPSHVWPAKKD